MWDVLQDRRGYLWLATTAGLGRYDGVAFTSVNDPFDTTACNYECISDQTASQVFYPTEAEPVEAAAAVTAASRRARFIGSSHCSSSMIILRRD